MTEDTHSYEGRAYQAQSGQWAWEITRDGTPIVGGGGYESEDEAWQDMYDELGRLAQD